MTGAHNVQPCYTAVGVLADTHEYGGQVTAAEQKHAMAVETEGLVLASERTQAELNAVSP